MKNETNGCQVCKELIKKIELTQTSYEAINLETALYRHKVMGECSNEKAA